MAKLPDIGSWSHEAAERIVSEFELLVSEKYGFSPAALLELVEAAKQDRLVALPSEDFVFRCRGDIALGLIKANCSAYMQIKHGEKEGGVSVNG